MTARWFREWIAERGFTVSFVDPDGAVIEAPRPTAGGDVARDSLVLAGAGHEVCVPLVPPRHVLGSWPSGDAAGVGLSIDGAWHTFGERQGRRVPLTAPVGVTGWMTMRSPFSEPDVCVHLEERLPHGRGVRCEMDALEELAAAACWLTGHGLRAYPHWAMFLAFASP